MKNEMKRQGMNITLIAIMVFIYLGEVLVAHSTDINSLVLYQFGAEYHPAVWAGQWWRLVTAGFVHVTFSHIFFNLVVMYFIGRLLEQEFGHWRILVLFVGTVVAGNMLGMVLSPANTVSAGASGGIYGYFGAILMLGVLDRRRAFWQGEAKMIALLMLLSIATSLFSPEIDLSAHIGGAVAGFILAPALMAGYHYAGAIKVNIGARILSALGFIGFVLAMYYTAVWLH